MKIKVAKIRICRVSLTSDRPDRITEFHTLDYFLNHYFGYTLDCGRSWQYERGAKKVADNSKIKSFKSLVSNLDKAKSNSCTHYQSEYYYVEAEGTVDDKNLPEGFEESSEGFADELVKVKAAK